MRSLSDKNKEEIWGSLKGDEFKAGRKGAHRRIARQGCSPLMKSRQRSFKVERVQQYQKLPTVGKAYCNEHCGCTASFSGVSFSISGCPLTNFNVLLSLTANTCDSFC